MENHENVEDNCENHGVSQADHEIAAPQLQDVEKENENTERNHKRFRQNQEVRNMQLQARYEDTESYIEQRAHSIGEGLYCTDDYQDLPPRFKKKFLNLLESVGFKIDHSKSEIISFSPNTNIDFGKKNPGQLKNVSSVSGAALSDAVWHDESSCSGPLSHQSDETGINYWSDIKSAISDEPINEAFSKKNNTYKRNRFVNGAKEHSDSVSEQLEETETKFGAQSKEHKWNNKREKSVTDFVNEKSIHRRHSQVEYSKHSKGPTVSELEPSSSKSSNDTQDKVIPSSHSKTNFGKLSKDDRHNDRYVPQKHENIVKKEVSHQSKFGKSIKHEVQNFIQQNQVAAPNSKSQTIELVKKFKPVGNLKEFKDRKNYKDFDDSYSYNAVKSDLKHGSNFTHERFQRKGPCNKTSKVSHSESIDENFKSKSSLENEIQMSKHNSAGNIIRRNLINRNVAKYDGNDPPCKTAQASFQGTSMSTPSNKQSFSANKNSNQAASIVSGKDDKFKQDHDKRFLHTDKRRYCKDTSVDSHEWNSSSFEAKNLKQPCSQKYQQSDSRPSSRASSSFEAKNLKLPCNQKYQQNDSRPSSQASSSFEARNLKQPCSQKYQQNDSRPSSQASSKSGHNEGSKMNSKTDKYSIHENRRVNQYNRNKAFSNERIKSSYCEINKSESVNDSNKNVAISKSNNSRQYQQQVSKQNADGIDQWIKDVNSLKDSKHFSSSSSFNNQREKHSTKSNGENVCVEYGFFLKINVSENSKDVPHWLKFFKNLFHHDKFEIDHCCNFSGTLIVNFELKKEALAAESMLYKFLPQFRKVKRPHVEKVSTLKTSIQKPCDCKEKILQDFHNDVKKLADIHIEKHNDKLKKILSQIKSVGNHEVRLTLKETVNSLEDSKTVFHNYIEKLYSQIETVETMYDFRSLRVDFSRECNSFARCLPIYSQKEKILELLRFYSVSVIVAETGSGKSTQLVEYFLQTDFAKRGKIICTQPRKIAAIGLAEYVSKQLGSSVGKIVGYDIGLEKKYCEETKILYMTDYCLLKNILMDKKLSGRSCVIVDEAHERTLHTDLLLSLLKICIASRPDFRVVITSATINPSVFKTFFTLRPEMIISIPGRLYPVEVVWLEEDVTPQWNYVEACLRLAHYIHVKKGKGDILVFLTSPSEIEDAIEKFKTMCKKNSLPQLIGLHGKSDLNEQRLIFQSSFNSRKVIFATNSAETSLTIPGIKYVVDSGMVKEKLYFPKKNKSSLVVSFINKSSAEQRKGRAGRTQPGICYRMYSKKNYDKDMKDRSLPELLKTNIQSAILKIMEFGIEPKDFDFVESPPKEAFSKSLESLELLGAVESNKLTDIGRKISQMTIEPRLAKLVLEGIKHDIGYESIIIASLVYESAKLFLRNDSNRDKADKMKEKFCKKEGDLCTFLDVFKQWQEVHWKERDAWCMRHCVSSKALRMASKTIEEILKNLRLDLGIHVRKRYNNSAFEKNFHDVIFYCFSENLCVFSGHPRVGYFSPYLSESFCIHPSSALSYLGLENPMFLVYSNLMETSRNFLLDVTPLSEDVLIKACNRGVFKLDIAMLKRFQILPKVLGPFGESILIRHVLGKGGKKIVDLECMIEKYTKTKNFKIDVLVEKGEIIIYVEKRFHEKIADYIHEMVAEAHKAMFKEEDIIEMSNSSSYCCLGAGGIISDIIMPGEFKEITIELLNFKLLNEVIRKIESFGEYRSLKIKSEFNKRKIWVTFEKVSEAQTALLQLSKEKGIHFVRSNVFIHKKGKKTLPLFTLDISWCRRPVSGSGLVEFESEESCVLASGALACSSFYIDNKYINFTPSKHSSRELHMTNLPAIVTEEIIMAKLKEHLPDFITVKSINLMRSRCDKLTEKDIGCTKTKLLKLFGRYSSSDKLIIDVRYPRSTDVNWRATVYFENLNDGECAFKQLNGKAEIDSFPVEIKQVLTSRLFCNFQVYKAVESEIDAFVHKKTKSKVCNHFSVEDNSKTKNVLIKFGCKNVSELNIMQQTIMKLLQGKQINFFGNSKYLFLFSQSGKSLLRYIQDSTRTYICLNDVRRIVSIYGSHEACREAELQIHKQATAPTTWKVFDIKRSSMPSGFLKALYSKYGFDLYELLNSCKLKVASVDVVAGTLTIEGDKESVKKAENELEEICSELYNSSKQTVSEENQEICPICLETINYDFLRLEHCGHAFCKQCLLLQLESRSFPVKCIKQNCDKLLFLEDIKKILSIGGMHLKKSFCLAAVQYHVNSNLDALNYCPTPDCSMVYRRSKETTTEFCCPLCENVICQNCQTVYHHGMSCEMYQNSKEDPDYSLKVWMKENKIDRKFCPKCKVAIEKNSGCNHVECLNCQAHLCWLCLKVFPVGKDVYEHQPYCLMNQ